MEDLENVAHWYAARHPAGVDRFLADFAKARDLLSTFPTAGRERPEWGQGLRSYVVHPFIVFHRVDDAGKRVIVSRILHAHLDLSAADFE